VDDEADRKERCGNTKMRKGLRDKLGTVAGPASVCVSSTGPKRRWMIDEHSRNLLLLLLAVAAGLEEDILRERHLGLRRVLMRAVAKGSRSALRRMTFLAGHLRFGAGSFEVGGELLTPISRLRICSGCEVRVIWH